MKSSLVMSILIISIIGISTVVSSDAIEPDDKIIPPPLKQMKMGIKLGHIICDEGMNPAWNRHFKPACVSPDSEMKLLERGWAKLRLVLPGSPDPIKELEWTGQNEVTYRILGNMRYGDEPPPSTLDEKKKIVWEYAQRYHPGERFLEYSIPTSGMYHFNVGDKVQFDLLEWGNYSDCWDLKVRIIDVHDQPVYEDNSIRYCLEPSSGGQPGRFASYSTGEEFGEFVCDRAGYYRIEVSNDEIFPPTILKNFACLDKSKFKIVGLNYANHPDDPLMITVEKVGYDMCDSWDAKIINTLDNSVVWERNFSTSCVVLDPPKQQKFEYKISDEYRPIVISKAGRYLFQVTIGETHLEQEFVVRNNFIGISVDRTVYPTIVISSPDYDPNPDSIILQIGVNSTTYWKNESNVPITLTSEDQRWSTGLIPPNEGKSIQFNETAFYEYRGLPWTAINGRIAILSDQTESLPIQEKLAIAREIIKIDMGNPITAIGIGNADNVLDIMIHEDELEKNPDSKEYYKKRYQSMIPFDVPIRIEFGHMEPQ